MSPDCTCREIDLQAWRVEPSLEAAPEPAPRGALRARLDLDSGALAIPADVPEGAQTHTDLAALVRRALRPEVLDLLRERWHRVKGLERDDEWRTADWSRIERDVLVPFMELFPSRWDLSVIIDREHYWAVDSWCLAPHCSCQEIAVEFLGDAGQRVGAIRIDVGHSAISAFLGDDRRLRLLGEKLLDDARTRQELRARRRLVRRLARELPGFLQSSAPRAPAAPPAPTLGRNSPCPCGSGKKHKRCCGR